MKIIGIVIGAALLTAAPFSMHCTSKKAGLYVDRADARVVHRRRLYYGYYGYYGIGTAYPGLFALTPYYGLPPYGGVTRTQPALRPQAPPPASPLPRAHAPTH